MTCRLIALSSVLLLSFLSPGIARGSMVKQVSVREAQNSVSLKIGHGYGLTISFQKTKERISQIWLADPSRIVFSTNAQCPADTATSCKKPASVIFLRQIKPLDFANITRSRDGSTQLVVLTDNQKQYIFELTPVAENPGYTSVVLLPAHNNRPFLETKPSYPKNPSGLTEI